jgi:hypothetical protein
MEEVERIKGEKEAEAPPEFTMNGRARLRRGAEEEEERA